MTATPIVIDECSECGNVGPCRVAMLPERVAICQNVDECEARIHAGEQAELLDAYFEDLAWSVAEY